jgi:[ribosomal protein S18]-alanine N-acetyltransferase
MSNIARRLFARRAPVLAPANPRDAHALAALHARSFHRAWSEGEFEALLSQSNIVAHRAVVGRALAGFVLSRMVTPEAEILSIAVARSRRGKGLAGQLLQLHLRRLAALGVGAVFLEVGEENMPALRLYRRAGFREIGRREAYYSAEKGSAALVLRRDLT